MKTNKIKNIDLKEVESVLNPSLPTIRMRRSHLEACGELLRKAHAELDRLKYRMEGKKRYLDLCLYKEEYEVKSCDC